MTSLNNDRERAAPMRDAQGFDEFYQRTSRRLLAYAFTISRDWPQAQDLAQEAYLRAWRRWDSVSGYADPESWLRLVVVRQATDFWRRLGRRQSAYRRTAASQPEVPAPSVETVLVTRALLELAPQQRQAIALHYLFDLPVAQIAEDLGVPTGTVKSWLSRGRVALADLLGPEQERDIPSSGQVRATGDRRTRRRVAVSAAATVVILLPGVAWAAQTVRREGPPVTVVPGLTPSAVPSPSLSGTPSLPPSGSPSPAATPSAGPSPLALMPSDEPTGSRACADPYPKKLPDRLFAKGINDSLEICYRPGPATGLVLPETLPRPCRPMSHPSDARIEDRRGRGTTVDEGENGNPAPTTYAHSVTRYRPGGAQAYLDELRAALDRCGPFTDEFGRRHDYKALSEFGAGPGRVVIRDEWTKPNPEETEAGSGRVLILAERVGDHVVVIHDWGWEGFWTRDSTLTAALEAAVRAL